MIFFESIFETLNCLTKEEYYILSQAIFKYAFYGEESMLEGALKGIFLSIKPNIDTANRNYDSKIANGKKGGAPFGNTNAKKQPKTTQNNLEINETQAKQPYDFDYDYDSEHDSNYYLDSNKEKDLENDMDYAKKPNEDDVKSYCIQHNIQLNEERFWDYGNMLNWNFNWKEIIKDFDATKIEVNKC